MLADTVGALDPVGSEGLDNLSSFVHRARHESAARVSLPFHLVHALGSGYREFNRSKAAVIYRILDDKSIFQSRNEPEGRFDSHAR